MLESPRKQLLSPLKLIMFVEQTKEEELNAVFGLRDLETPLNGPLM